MGNTKLVNKIRGNYARVLDNIATASARVGRKPTDVTTVGISKTFDLSVVEAGYKAGLRDIGENRVQEAQSKIIAMEQSVRWHLVGHLQRNKARTAVNLFDVIHSVDSLRLARILTRHVGPNCKFLIQVNLTGNPKQHGLIRSELPAVCAAISDETTLTLDGLMTMAPFTEEETRLRSIFSELRELIEDLRSSIPQQPWTHLSMGMTSDYQYAIQEGATIIRLGRAIFGERG